MDAKTVHRILAANRREAAKHDQELSALIQRGKERAAKYKENWPAIEFNAFIARFAPNPTRTQIRGKIYYHSPGSDLIVMVDVGGWYFRLYSVKEKMYLGVDGKNAYNYITERGTQAGRSHKEWLAMTHFRIKKTGE